MRENEYMEGKIDESKLHQSIESIIGMMKHYNVFECLKKYLRKTSLRRPNYD